MDATPDERPDERSVPSGAAVLRVLERGTPAGGPTLLLAHGWPDTHEVWDLVADRLADRFHVVVFDVRGVGASALADLPGTYRLEALAADVGAVARAVRPDGPVHLVGHDWGSVTGWEVVQTPALAERIASFTSLSGPCLDHLGATLRGRVRRPSPSRLAPVVAQGTRSAYTVVLSAPVLGTGMWRLGADRLLRRWLRVAEGIPADGGYPGPDLARAARAAVPVYRQNIWRKLRRPDQRPVAVPVQLVVAGADRYVSPRVFEDVEGWVTDLTRSELAAGHWAPRTHPAEVAGRIAAFVDAVEARRAPDRAAAG